ILIAAASNNVAKGAYALYFAKGKTGRQSLMLLAGLAALGLVPLLFWGSMRKVRIVPGASRGIGAAVARLAAADGYSVCVNSLNNQDAAAAVVSSIAAGGGNAIAVKADVAVEQDVIRLFEQVDASLGRVTALVN